jgi:hypothetical protein
MIPYTFFVASFVLHALHISSSLAWPLKLYLVKSTSNEFSHYAAFFNPMAIHLSLVQIFSSAPCSQTPSVYVPSLMSKTKCCTHTAPQTVHINCRIS